mmetsp:Transcript_191/g.728  ORF Transcript_191/g.728 Transcript_191/m.728 type:complete len:236 (-) Transcript_191:456-1163(-)
MYTALTASRFASPNALAAASMEALYPSSTTLNTTNKEVSSLAGTPNPLLNVLQKVFQITARMMQSLVSFSRDLNGFEDRTSPIAGIALRPMPTTTGTNTCDVSFVTAAYGDPTDAQSAPRYMNISAGVMKIPAKLLNTAWKSDTATFPSAAFVSATPLPMVVGKHASTTSPSTSLGVRTPTALSAGPRTYAVAAAGKPNTNACMSALARTLVTAFFSSVKGRLRPDMRNMTRIMT